MAFTKIAAAGIGSTETVTLHSLEVLNNATVGGVLTYEDVTNVDSIGIVTARAGVLVGSGITLSKDGDIFATGVTTTGSLVSSGDVTANGGDMTISGASAILHLVDTNDNPNYRVQNIGGTFQIYDATTDTARLAVEPAGNINIAKNLNVSGLTTTGIISAFTNTDGTTDLLTLHADADGTNNGVASIKFTGNTGNHSAYIKGGHTTNGDTILTFHTDDYASGFNPEERLRITSAGLIGVNVTPTSHNDTTAFQIHDTYNSQGYPRLRLTNQSTGSASSDGFEISLDGSNLHAIVRQRENADIHFYTNNTEKLRITSDGHLQIGNDTGIIKLGTGEDLQLIHDGSASKIIAKPEFMLQSDEFTFRSENGSTTHAIINSSGQIGIGTNVPGAAVSVNGSVKFASGTSVGGPAMLVQPHDDITLAGNASATLSFGSRFTGIVIVSGKSNDTAAGCWALASASSYSSDGVYRIFLQNHAAANTTDLTITSPSHGGTHQYQLNQTGSATKTYKIIAFGIKE